MIDAENSRNRNYISLQDTYLRLSFVDKVDEITQEENIQRNICLGEGRIKVREKEERNRKLKVTVIHCELRVRCFA